MVHLDFRSLLIFLFLSLLSLSGPALWGPLFLLPSLAESKMNPISDVLLDLTVLSSWNNGFSSFPHFLPTWRAQGTGFGVGACALTPPLSSCHVVSHSLTFLTCKMDTQYTHPTRLLCGLSEITRVKHLAPFWTHRGPQWCYFLPKYSNF